MRLSATAFAALGAALGGAASLAAQRPDSLHTRFDWPVGMRATVEFERVRSRALPGKRADSSRFAAAYRLRVLPHEKGRLVHTDSFVVRAAPRLGGGLSQPLPSDLAASVQPAYVVSDSGTFVGVANIERMKAFLDSAVAASARSSALGAEQRQALASFTSTETLSAIAAQYWDAAVSTWSGEDWVIGKRYQGSGPTAVAWLPGFELQLRYTLAAEARVPCTVGETASRCVRLRMRSRPDSASLRELLVAVSRMARMDEQVNFATMMRDTRIDTEVVVIAEPSTLRPYEVSITRHTRFVVPSSPREQGGAVAASDAQRYRYRY